MKYAFFLMTLLVLVVLASGCTNNENQTSNQSQTFNQSNQSQISNQSKIPSKTYSSANGISFNYPKGWERSDGEGVRYSYSYMDSDDLNMRVSFGDTKSSVKGEGWDYYTSFVIVQRSSIPFGFSLKNLYDNALSEATHFEIFESISNTTTTVDGNKAYVAILLSSDNGFDEKIKAVWFEKNGFAYVILLITLPKDFDSEQANFDVILNSFKVQ